MDVLNKYYFLIKQTYYYIKEISYNFLLIKNYIKELKMMNN